VTDPADDVNPTIRGLLTRFLVGAGVELGPGHHPMPVLFSDVTIRYVDRWDPEQNRALFPDVAAGSTFTTPDVIANLDVDRLSALSDESQDFVIASHLLEHLANPLAQLEDMHRVLRRGGVALIFLPDRRYTFDRKRSPTPLEHLIADHRDQVTVASDEHLEDHLRKTGVWQDSLDGRGSPPGVCVQPQAIDSRPLLDRGRVPSRACAHHRRNGHAVGAPLTQCSWRTSPTDSSSVSHCGVRSWTPIRL